MFDLIVVASPRIDNPHFLIFRRRRQQCAVEIPRQTINDVSVTRHYGDRTTL